MNSKKVLLYTRIARVLYFIVGCFLPILIGGLHLFVHFQELVKPEVFKLLQKEVFILGKIQPLWNTWGITSFMMGASFIVIGIINVGFNFKSKKNELLAFHCFLAMMV